MPGPPTVSAVMLAYGEEPVLEEAVDAVLASHDVVVEVVLVDNGGASTVVDALAARPGVTIVRPGRNTGFAGGCNLGATRASGEFLAFVNGDAVVRPEALRRLVDVAAEKEVALASASLRLYDRPDVVNSAGNPLHYTGLSWAGGLGEPATRHAVGSDVASVTGAAVVARATVFAELGGFCELMFAYCEDAELSLRAWQRGWRCRYVPDAVVMHRYEFSRNPHKAYLLERNRLLLIMTLYERRTLGVLGAALVGLELAIAVVAVRQGWFRQKAAGWLWLWRHRTEVRRRRCEVQAARTRSDAELAWLLTGDFTPGADTGISAPGPLRVGSRVYWQLARGVIERRVRHQPT